MILRPDEDLANADWPKQRKQRRVWKDCYVKDFGDGKTYMSGLPLPRDSDGVTRNVDFVNCDFHPASDGVFENCTINGQSIPDGPGSLYRHESNLGL